MIESEAKTKWCPMAREMARDGDATVSANFGVNRNGGEWRSPCIGSACMMWRDIHEYSNGVGDGFTDPTKPLAGYCGLAGKP